MSRWFRMYDDVLNDPKAQKLSDAAFRGWVNLMCLASKHDGRLDQPLEDIAFALRRSVARTEALLDCLLGFGLLDRTETGWQPHNWELRQFKSDVSTARVKRFRQQAVGAPETPPESESEAESDSETEQKETVLSDPPADADSNAGDSKSEKRNYTPEFEAFWRDYPTDALMSKSKAFEKWRRLNAADRAAAHGAVPAFRAYCEKHVTYRPVHAERFLSQRRFDGFAAVQPSASSPEDAALRDAWGGRASPLIDAIGAAKFQAWFAGTELADGVLTVAKPFVQDWIARHFMGDLRRLYGDLKIKVRE